MAGNALSGVFFQAFLITKILSKLIFTGSLSDFSALAALSSVVTGLPVSMTGSLVVGSLDLSSAIFPDFSASFAAFSVALFSSVFDSVGSAEVSSPIIKEMFNLRVLG